MLVLGLGTAHAQRPNQAEDESVALVEEGRAALRSNHLDDAAKALDQAIALNPRRVEAYVLRSAVFAARKQYKDGVAVMERARAIAPDDPEVLVALGSQLVLAGDAASGVPLLERVVAKEPARYDAQVLLGHHWYAAGKWPDAITAYEAYFGHRPAELAREDARHRIELADAYLRDRQPKKALELFRAVEAARPDLRARLGIAWATAAIDCRQARARLKELEPVAREHPEVWLVDGQCALALGDPSAALALGRRYLDLTPANNGGGHALVGEALAARGNLADARKELETARSLEPQHRRWTVRLAYVLRRSGHADEAVKVLDELGAPGTPASEPDWWLELGEALLAHGDATTAVARLTPVAGELVTDAAIHTVLGAAQLQAGALDAAVKTLDEAEAIQSTPRSRKLLGEALVEVGVAKLGKNDAAGAVPVLARAEQLEPSAAASRDLGIALLAANKPADAVAPLERAIKLDAAPIAIMLAARAHALAGEVAAARPLYERALAGDKADAVEIALDWSASELAGGDPALAVAALEKTAAAAKTGPLAQRHKAALAAARHAAGLAQLRAGNGSKAFELLRAAEASDPSVATKCDVALAAVVANDVSAALAALRGVTGQSCPFPPPADTQAAPILTAFVTGLSPRQAARALRALTALGAKSTGAAQTLLGTAIRVVALNAAQEAYRSGQLAHARSFLATARAANARVGGDEIAHDLAVLDLADGRVDAAIRELERLSTKVPEALVNLGLAYEKAGDQQRALDAWKRARKLGVRFAPLTEWIESKERVYGEKNE
ncbi:MAG: tetratricopeptide repeat protein [Acidobacteriota bacterium]